MNDSYWYQKLIILVGGPRLGCVNTNAINNSCGSSFVSYNLDYGRVRKRGPVGRDIDNYTSKAVEIITRPTTGDLIRAFIPFPSGFVHQGTHCAGFSRFARPAREISNARKGSEQQPIKINLYLSQLCKPKPQPNFCAGAWHHDVRERKMVET